MSEQAPERPPGAGAGNMLTRKYGGVPGWAWAGLVAVAAGAFFWWRARKASSSASPAQPSPASATCYDAQGNTVDCASPQAVADNSTDQFEALYAQTQGINSQLENIAPTVTETGQDTDAIQAWLSEHQGPGSQPVPVGSRPPIPLPPRPGPVTDLTVDVISPTLARVSWRPPQFASHAPTSTTYTIQVKGKDPAAHPIGSRTSYNVGGLKPSTSYTAVVAPAGGPSASKEFTTPKKGTKAKPAPAGRAAA